MSEIRLTTYDPETEEYTDVYSTLLRNLEEIPCVILWQGGAFLIDQEASDIEENEVDDSSVVYIQVSSQMVI
jgi:hypothetical protein